MKGRLLLLALALTLLIPVQAQAQDQEPYTEVEAPVALKFVERFHAGSTIHGLARDNEGRIWVSAFGSGQPIYVYNPDGTQADISPIESVTIDGQEIPTDNGGRGITVDHEGHILAVTQNSILVRINSETGEGMSMWQGNSSLTAPGVDSEGYAYISQVVSAPPIYVLDIEAGFSLALTIDEGSAQTWLSRSTAVNDMGDTVYSPQIGTSGTPHVYIYTSEDFVNYERTDSVAVFDGDVSSNQWRPNGELWFTDEGLNAQVPGLSTQSLVALDTENRTYYKLTADSLDLQPRGLAFNATGDTVYVGSFYSGLVSKFALVDPSQVDVEQPEVASAFTLSGNHPNPFARQTTIDYTLQQPSAVRLEVFDALGRRVATLVDARQAAGAQSVVWDGTDAQGQPVSDGVYFYRLQAGGSQAARPMVLVR